MTLRNISLCALGDLFTLRLSFLCAKTESAFIPDTTHRSRLGQSATCQTHKAFRMPGGLLSHVGDLPLMVMACMVAYQVVMDPDSQKMVISWAKKKMGNAEL